MASSRQFSLEYSSSEDEAQPSRFNFGDLPKLVLPSPFQSDSSALTFYSLQTRDAGNVIVTWELSWWRVLIYPPIISDFGRRIWYSHTYSWERVYQKDVVPFQERSEATASLFTCFGESSLE